MVVDVNRRARAERGTRELNDRGFDLLLVEDATASYVPAFKAAAIEAMTAFGGDGRGGIVCSAASSAQVVAALEAMRVTA